MYALVREILDTGKENGVDIIVARDMVVAKGKDFKEVDAAYKIIDTYYDTITFFNRTGNEAGIETVCNLYAEGKKSELKEFIKTVREENNH